MKKPIDRVEFWERRLEQAKMEGNLASSVFVTDTWASINQAHKSVLQSHIGPLDSVLDAGCGYGRGLDVLPPCKGYYGVDQVPSFIAEAKTIYPNSTYSYVLPERVTFVICKLESLPDFSDGCVDWVIGISLMVMIISNLGWDKWDEIQTELLRVSKRGVLCLEYTNPEVFYWIKKV